MPPTLTELTERMIAFRDERDWRRFHSLKNLIQSVNIEAGELLELTQWLDDADADARLDEPEFRARLAEECADVLLYLLLIAERSGFTLEDAAAEKMKINARKYPVEKARGNARKYTDL
jgi:NTP pyrophosphatase (non-canonical NTP hydrolase)